MKNLLVQRFAKEHQYYSDVIISHDDKQYQAVFGQCIDAETKEFISFTMERRDTLIPEGIYPFTYYNSPINHSKVPLLHDVPGFEYIEHHIANYPFEIKGCTAHGSSIDATKPMLIGSGIAFNKLMKFLNQETGMVKYETLQ